MRQNFYCLREDKLLFLLLFSSAAHNGYYVFLNTVTMFTKILTCYISETVRDRPIVIIIHR